MNIKNVYDKVKGIHPDIDSWETVSIRMEFGPDAVDSIAAAILCGSTDEPWLSLRAFEKVAIVINDRPVMVDILQDLLPRDLAYAVTVLKTYWPNEKFNDEVAKYTAAVFDINGIVVAPTEVEFIQPFLPLVRLSEDQATVQKAYIQEIKDYCEIMAMKDHIGTGGDTK